MPTIRFFARLRTIAGCTRVEVPGATVRGAILAACDQRPALCDAMLDEHGNLRPLYVVTLNGRHIDLAQGLDTPTTPDDEIALFSPLAGG